jgi:hypothetical protein
LKRSEREELVELRRENRRLRLEREILKKPDLRSCPCFNGGGMSGKALTLPAS